MITALAACLAFTIGFVWGVLVNAAWYSKHLESIIDKRVKQLVGDGGYPEQGLGNMDAMIRRSVARARSTGQRPN